MGGYCIFKRKSKTTWSPMALSPVTYCNNEAELDQPYRMLEDVNKTSPILQPKSSTKIKLDEGHGENKYPWVSWLPRIMFSMN